jgi:Tfp pilus assembly protein PilN
VRRNDTVIKVNLLPGSRAARKRGLSFSLPSRKGGGGANRGRRDGWVLGAAAVVLLSLVGAGWLYLGVSGRADDLSVQIEQAVRDSVRYADLISDATALQARRDTLAERVSLIQEIDGARYVWPHIMDEVARAVPEYTWLTAVTQVTPGPTPSFRLEGRSGNTFALTRFMTNLGDSPFLQNVTLIAANQVGERDPSDPSGRMEQVQQFTIEAAYRNPPPELLQLVPLFAPGFDPGDDR